MAAYYMNEGSFDLPDMGFVDQTTHVFEAVRGEDRTVGLIVCRTPFPQGKSLRELVAAHVTHEAKRLSSYRILDEAETTRAGVPAIEIRSRWRHDGKPVYQRQAHLAANETWLLFGMSTSIEDQALCDKTMERILATLALAGGA
jgi:hypothetical protein